MGFSRLSYHGHVGSGCDSHVVADATPVRPSAVAATPNMLSASRRETFPDPMSIVSPRCVC